MSDSPPAKAPASIDIAEVARRTGLTSRALRFYEARGLLRPLRTMSGRRHYGPAELERVHQILTLKRAGLGIAQIERLTSRGAIDLAALVDAQIAAITEQRAQLDETHALLTNIKSRIDRSEPIDVATFCSLIRQGESVMTDEAKAWKAVTDKYMSDEAKADFAKSMPKVSADFDQAEYSAKWADLGARIKAAMPMDPASEAARAFVKEWFTLLKPFTDVATPAMWAGSANMYANMGEWQGKSAANPGFDLEVFQFIQTATTVAKAAGHDLGPAPAWIKG